MTFGGPTLQGPCGRSPKRRGSLRFLPPFEVRPSSVAPEPAESREALPPPQRQPGKFPKVPGRRRGTRGFPAAPRQRPRASQAPGTSPTLPQPAPSRARTLEARERWARLAQARAASRPGLCAPAQGNQSLSRELRASALCPGLAKPMLLLTNAYNGCSDNRCPRDAQRSHSITLMDCLPKSLAYIQF